jgi:O-antigen/teichoic acid export membrane protein
MSIKIHTIWNIAGSAVPLVVAAATIPHLVNSLGVESFGVLTLIWTLIGYFSLFDLGLGRAITHHISSKLDIVPMSEIINRINVGLIYTSLAGLLGAVIIFAIAEPATGWMKVSHAIHDQTYQAFVFSALAIPFVALSSGMKGILEAFDHFGQVNLVRIFQGITTFALPVLSVYCHGPDLGMIALYLGLSRIAVLACYLVSVRKLVGENWHFTFSNLTFDSSLLKFGGWMTLSNIISPLLVYFDRFVISSVIGSHTVAYYTVPFEIATRLLIIPGAMGSALFPKLASRYHNPSKTIGHLIKHSLATIMLVMALLCLILYLAYQPVVSWWISKEFADASKNVVSILAIGIWMNSLGFIAYTALQAKTGAKQTALLHLIELLLFIPMLYLFLIKMGINGAAVAWTIRVSFDALAMFWLLQRSR